MRDSYSRDEDESFAKMSDDFSARQVRRFDGTNFQCWKFQITAVLVANEIYDVVDGSRTLSADRVGAKTWIRDNAKATATIASAMESLQLECVLMCSTAKAMWGKTESNPQTEVSDEQVGPYTMLP